MTRAARPARSALPVAVLVAVAAVVAVAAGLLAGAGGAPADPFAATFTRTASWSGGYAGEFVITNRGSAVDGWVLDFDLPAGQRVENEWNGALTGSASRYVVTSLSWDAHLATGATAEVGFQVQGGSGDASPTSCSLAGGSCAVSGEGPGAQPAPASTPATTTTTLVAAPTSVPAPPATEPEPPGAVPGFWPYVDATVDTPPFDLLADMRASGTRHFTLAFVVSQSGTCVASWGGYHLVSTGYYRPEITALRAAGGEVAISFGGAAGTELADVCDLRSLEAQYRSVVEEYGVSRLDFDIEGADLMDTASMTRRFEAIAALETADPSLRVSVTVPVLPSGLDAGGLEVLHTAVSVGARVDLVNIMAMDYGDGAAPAPAGRMGTYAIQAADATEGQLASLYPGRSTAELWAMVGVTPMAGVNDVADEVFGTADAARLLAFAGQVGLGGLSMWAATRDVECAGGAATAGSDTCTGIHQDQWAFSEVFARYG